MNRGIAPGPSYESATIMTFIFGTIAGVELLAIFLVSFYLFRLRQVSVQHVQVIAQIMKRMGKQNMPLDQFVDESILHEQQKQQLASETDK